MGRRHNVREREGVGRPTTPLSSYKNNVRGRRELEQVRKKKIDDILQLIDDVIFVSARISRMSARGIKIQPSQPSGVDEIRVIFANHNTVDDG